MNHPSSRLGALVSLVLLAACSGNSASAPAAKSPVTTAATMQSVTLQPTGGQHQLVPGVASWLDQYDGDYRLCIPSGCAMLLPVTVMEGWSVTLISGNDGTPLLSFKPSGVARPQYQLDAARDLMRVRLAEVAARLAVKTSKQFCADGDGDNPLRGGNGRTSKTAAQPGGSSLCGGTGTGDPEPDPPGGGGAGGFDGPVVPVPGELPPHGDPWGGVPGGGGLEPPVPDGGGGGTSEVSNPVPYGCVALPPAELICGLPVVPVPAPKPDPDTLPNAPPVWGWCSILGIGCNGPSDPPRPQLPPELDPHKVQCQTEYVIGTQECLHNGERIVDPALRHESINACFGRNSVAFAHCMGENPVFSPAGM